MLCHTKDSDTTCMRAVVQADLSRAPYLPARAARTPTPHLSPAAAAHLARVAGGERDGLGECVLDQQDDVPDEVPLNSLKCPPGPQCVHSTNPSACAKFCDVQPQTIGSKDKVLPNLALVGPPWAVPPIAPDAPASGGL